MVDNMDEDGMDIEMEEIIDSDVVKKEAEQRQKMKQAALESGIEPEQVDVEDVGGAVDVVSGKNIEDDDMDVKIEEQPWNYSCSSMKPVTFGLIVFSPSYLVALTALGLLIQMWFTPLFVWGFLPAPLLWLSYVYLFRETTRSTASPLRVVETFCLGLVLDVPVVLAQWGTSYYIVKAIPHIHQRNEYLMVVVILAYVLADAFIVQAIPEEVIKYLCVWRLRNSTDLRSRYGCVVYAVASSGGVALLSGLLNILEIYWNPELPLLDALLSFAIAITLECGVHVVAGIWVGNNASKRFFRKNKPRPVWKVLLGPVFINAMYNLFTTSMELLDESGFLKWWIFVICVCLAGIFVVFSALYSMSVVQAQKKDPRYYAPVNIDDPDLDEMDDGWL